MPFTIGVAGGSQVTSNFDALISTSLAKYRKKMQDAISSANAFYYELKKQGAWEAEPGSLYIAEDLMYELGQFDAYEGYDELGDTPTDGITQVQFQWRQGSVPVIYSEMERKKNKTRIINLVQAKIKQCEMGWIEGFNKALLQGSVSQGGVSLTTPFTSSANGALFIDPLPRLVSLNTTGSLEIGNLNQQTHTWWRNQTKESTMTTAASMLAEWDTMYNNCSKGPGGSPNLILCDQTTFELLNQAYYAKFQTQLSSMGNYPFDNIKFRNAKVVWDEYVPDIFSVTAGTGTFGTAWFLNTKFFRIVYEEETLFEMTPFAKPPKGDSRLAHSLFMGQTTMSNRRKQGVIGKIPRTLV